MDIVTALTLIITAILTSMATKWHVEKQLIPSLAAAITAVITTVCGSVWNWRKMKASAVLAEKVKIAETVAPSITSVPSGSDTTAHIIVNDPKTPDPPTIIYNEVKGTP